MPPCVHRAPPHSAPHPRRRSGRRRRRPLAPPAHLRLEQPARRSLARLPPARLAPSLHSAGLALARVARLEPPARRHLEQQARPRLVRHRRLVSDLNKPLGSWGLDMVLLACLHWQPSSQGTLCPTAKLCPACTPVLAAFGATPAFGGSPGFGASAPAFGATSTPAFGASATPAFGQPLTAFGSTTFGGAAPAAGVASSGRACLLPAHASSAPPPADLPCRKLPPPTTAGCMPGADPACCLRLHPGPRPAGGFGGPGFGGGARGTRQVAYRKTQEQDTSGSSGAKTIVFFNSISCMQEYVGKSAEELRWEDYQVCGRVWPVYRRMRVCVWCEVVRAGVQEHTCGERRRDPAGSRWLGPTPPLCLLAAGWVQGQHRRRLARGRRLWGRHLWRHGQLAVWSAQQQPRVWRRRARLWGGIRSGCHLGTPQPACVESQSQLLCACCMGGASCPDRATGCPPAVQPLPLAHSAQPAPLPLAQQLAPPRLGALAQPARRRLGPHRHRRLGRLVSMSQMLLAPVCCGPHAADSYRVCCTRCIAVSLPPGPLFCSTRLWSRQRARLWSRQRARLWSHQRACLWRAQQRSCLW